MDKSNLVGIVTVTYNSANVIADFLESLLKQTYADFVLYVVDNSSSDGTLSHLDAYQDPKIVLIQSQNNLGIAEGNNIGIRAALRDGCGLVLLINNDTVFESDFLEQLTAGLSKHECDMVAPKILCFDKPNTIWYAGGYFNAWRMCGNHFGKGDKDHGQFDFPKSVPYSPACCMLIKSEVFHRVGFMDPSYFLYFDDTDFCLRAHKVGVRLFYLPSARLRHKVSSLTGGTTSLALRYITRNHVYYILKHCSSSSIPFYLLVFYIYLPGKYLFLMRRPKVFWVTQKAFWEGIRLFARNRQQSNRTSEPTRTTRSRFG